MTADTVDTPTPSDGPVPATAPTTQPGPSAAWRERLIGAVVFAACLSLLLVAQGLEPAGTGATAVGTHTALGLPPCGFERATGLPCATCGMTTATSLAVHGQLLDALRVQPAGLLFALAVACAAVAGLWSAISGMSLEPLWQWFWRPTIVGSAVAVLIGAWVYKLAATLL